MHFHQNFPKKNILWSGVHYDDVYAYDLLMIVVVVVVLVVVVMVVEIVV
jgi:hypothetical protein